MSDNPYLAPKASIPSTTATAGSLLFGWLFVAVSSYILGAVLSNIASSYGVTNFPNDRRGEWAPVVIPMMLLLSGGLGILGYRRLTRPPGRAHWQILAVALTVTGASFCWITWRFANAAA